MRDGEIVRDRSGVIFRRLADGKDYDGYYRPEFRLEIVTVGELFAAAGHPVPDESYLVLEEMNRYGVCAWLAVHSTGTTLHFRSLNGEIGWRSSARSNAPPYSLSRLPALDAWDALPEIIKAVVK